MEDEKKPETAPKPAEAKKKPHYQELNASKHLDTKEQKAVVGGAGRLGGFQKTRG